MDTHQKATIIAGRIEGKTVREIAKECGVNPSTISRAARKDGIREIIQHNQEMAIQEFAETSRLNVKHAINGYRKPGKKRITRLKDGTEIEERVFDEQLREHGFKASLKMLEGMGVFPSQGTSVVINQFNQINVSEMPEEIKQLLDDRRERLGAMDVEFEEL